MLLSYCRTVGRFRKWAYNLFLLSFFKKRNILFITSSLYLSLSWFFSLIPWLLPPSGETLKEQQVSRHLPKSSSSTSSTSRLRDLKETMSNILHSRTLSSSSSSASIPVPDHSSESSTSYSSSQQAFSTSPHCFSSKPQDWEAGSTSSESKSSSIGSGSGRNRPAWKPRREALNIDNIFTRRRQAGYSQLSSSLFDDSVTSAKDVEFLSKAPQKPLTFRPGFSRTLSTFSSHRSVAGGGAEIPATLPCAPSHGLIQRMESGYESSERNSNSPISLDLNLDLNLNLGERWGLCNLICVCVYQFFNRYVHMFFS